MSKIREYNHLKLPNICPISCGNKICMRVILYLNPQYNSVHLSADFFILFGSTVRMQTVAWCPSVRTTSPVNPAEVEEVYGSMCIQHKYHTVHYSVSSERLL